MNQKRPLILAACSILFLLWMSSIRAEGAIDADQFTLIDAADGKSHQLRSLLGDKATVVYFASNECPTAVGYQRVLSGIVNDWKARGVALVAVNSNHGESLQQIDMFRVSSKLPYPLYQDAGGRIADALGATRTSEVALLDSRGNMVYRGRIDDRISTVVKRSHATTHELRDAIDATLAGKPAPLTKTEASGCFIARAPVAKQAADITYTKDVAPIIDRYCVTCHRPGQAGPMALQTYEQVAAWSRTIVDALRQNRMPPSRLAPPDPRFGEWQRMPEPTAAEIETIAKWADAGAPRGPAPKMAAKPAIGNEDEWLIGNPDLILTMPTSFAVPATGTVNYQYYKLLTYTGDDRWVDAIEVKPGVRSVVHHANVYMAQPDLLTVGFESGERWASFAPGRPPSTFPAGVARRLPKGATLTLEVHYTPDGVAREDRTRIGLRFAKAPPKYEARNVPLGNLNFRIPPSAPNHEVVATYTLKADAKIAGFTPHMHDRGKSMRYEATFPDGTTRTLLSVPKYNFKWQFVYAPKEMIALPKDTVLRAIATYDNSADNPTNPDPSATVTFGLQTWEEMMFGFVDVVYDEPADSPKLIALRGADRDSLPGDRGFDSWEALIAWAQEFRARPRPR